MMMSGSRRTRARLVVSLPSSPNSASRSTRSLIAQSSSGNSLTRPSSSPSKTSDRPGLLPMRTRSLRSSTGTSPSPGPLRRKMEQLSRILATGPTRILSCVLFVSSTSSTSPAELIPLFATCLAVGSDASRSAWPVLMASRSSQSSSRTTRSMSPSRSSSRSQRRSSQSLIPPLKSSSRRYV